MNFYKNNGSKDVINIDDKIMSPIPIEKNVEFLKLIF